MPQAQTGNKVRVHYTGKLSDGKVFDSSLDSSGFGEPLEFVIGQGQMIPGFEQGVLGMEPGETKTVNIPAEHAYGPHHPQGVMEVDRNQLPSGMPLEVGGMIHGNSPNGEQVAFTVVEVTANKVTLDGNHPLAGQDLTFEIQLVEME